MGLKMSEQLELFPELMWENYEYNGKIYKRYTGGLKLSRKSRLEQRMKVQRFIDEQKNKTI